MGKSPTAKRLVLWVDKVWASHPLLLALEEKGHTILPIPETDLAPHLILSQHAWNWSDEMWSKPTYLDVAIKAARERKSTRV